MYEMDRYLGALLKRLLFCTIGEYFVTLNANEVLWKAFDAESDLDDAGMLLSASLDLIALNSSLSIEIRTIEGVLRTVEALPVVRFVEAKSTTESTSYMALLNESGLSLAECSRAERWSM
jgi:hypothetical protein